VGTPGVSKPVDPSRRQDYCKIATVRLSIEQEQLIEGLSLDLIDPLRVCVLSWRGYGIDTVSQYPKNADGP